MKKRLLSLLLALCMALAWMPVSAQAEATGGSCGTNLTWNLDDTGTLTISGTGSMSDFRPWADYYDKIRNVEIRPGATSICTSAFNGCYNLANVTIPSSVKSIGPLAFASCSSLTSITIPESVETIDHNAFASCFRLTSVTIPGSVKFGSSVFNSCTGLKTAGPIGGDYNIKFGWTETIPSFVFYDCSLKSVTIPGSITSVEEHAFGNGSDLVDVYYQADESRWKAITIGDYNSRLTNATIHYASCTVTLDPNGGAVSPFTLDVTNGQSYGALPTPTREGYAFDGWFTAASGGTQVTATDTVNLTANQTLYAHWTEDAETPVGVTGVTLNKSSTSIEVGKTEELTATVAPANASDKSVTWSSSNESVATVSDSGVVTAVGAGTATITVTTADGSKTATCVVTVTEGSGQEVAVTDVSLNKTNTSIEVGKTEELTATIAPANAADKSVTWSSSDESVATVSNSGVVTAVGAGTATITVTTTDGGKTAACEVMVTARGEATEYIVHVGVMAHGTISPDKTDVATGETVTLTVAPAEGYQLEEGSLSVTDSSGTKVNISGSGNSYTFTMPAGNVTITAEFEPLSATETGVVLDKTELFLTEDGTADLKATVTSEDAGTVTWSVSPEGIVELKTDGNTVTVTAKKAGSATITASIGGKTASCTVTVTETVGPKKTYTVNFNANDGTVTPTSMTTDEDGRLTAKLPTPTREGYTFIGWFTEKENGENVPDDKAFTADTTLYAHWTQTPAQKYKLTVTNGTADGKTSGEYPAEAEVTITADAAPDGKIFDKWTTHNGGSFVSDTSASTKFTMPAADVTVTATYKDAQTAADSTNPANHLYNIYLPNAAGGVVTASTLSSYAGVYVPLTAYPNRGYELEIIFLVDGAGNRIPVSYSGGQYWFLMPSSNVTVYAYFVPTASNTAPVTGATTSRPMVSSAPETPPLAINIFASKTGNVGRVSYSVDFSLSATATGGDCNYSYQFEIKQKGTLTRSTGWISNNVFSGFISGSGPCVAEITVKDSSGKAVRITVDVLTGKTITPAEQVSVLRA